MVKFLIADDGTVPGPSFPSYVWAERTDSVGPAGKKRPGGQLQAPSGWERWIYESFTNAGLSKMYSAWKNNWSLDIPSSNMIAAEFFIKKLILKYNCIYSDHNQ